jgi:tight adherence protein C
MPLLPFILLFLFTAGAICLFGYLRFARPASLLDQLKSSTEVKPIGSQSTVFGEERASGAFGILEAIGRVLPLSRRGIARLRNELAAAGYRASSAVYSFLGIRVVSCAMFLLLGIAGCEYLASSTFDLRIVPFAAAAGGYLLPGFALGKLAARRREAIRLALPDVLDLLVISTEAGCALDKAILNVSREFRSFHPAISEELSTVNREMLAGKSRMEALRDFADRTGEEEVKRLIAILIQTDRFGTSVAEALRTQSDSMRVKRRQVAEERAGKVGVKLIFPIFFFCMPSLMVVVAGPAILQLFKTLRAIASLN